MSEQQAAATAGAKRWYVVHAYSGMEKAVERNLRSASNAPACRTSSAASWFRPRKWSN
jgi:hypothetical protein